MDLGRFRAALVSLPSAFLASLCCLLPLLIILLGLGSGAFMIYTMRYSYIFIPAGVAGVTLGHILYFREKKRCDAIGCRIAGKGINLLFLIVATVVVSFSIFLQIFPGVAASLIGME